MTHRRRCLRTCTASALALLLLLPPVARAQEPAGSIYRCGNTYSSKPCPGGQQVDADDARTDAQRQQAQAVQRQTEQQAQALAAERRAREQASAGQQAARIGPSEAERALAEAAKVRQQTHANNNNNKLKKPKTSKGRKLGQA